MTLVRRTGAIRRAAASGRGARGVLASVGLAAVGALGAASGMTAAAEAPAAPGRLGLSVSPAPLTVLPRHEDTLSVANRGEQPVNLQLTVGDYTLGPDGRPLFGPGVNSRRSARTWLRLDPRQLRLEAGQRVNVQVSAVPPRSATPGDHNAIVLVTTGAQAAPGRFAVRHRIGVGVLVRVPGPIMRRLAIGRLIIRRSGKRDVLRLNIRNLGNINERLATGQVSVQLRRGGRVLATFRPRPRSLLPGTAGDVIAARAGHRRGRYTAVIRLRFASAAQAGPSVSSAPATLVRRVRVRL